MRCEESGLVVADDFCRTIEDELALVERELRRMVGNARGLLPAVYRHTLEAGGKRIRPALVLLVAKALGASDDHLPRLAAAPEAVHIASLIHDDVVDGADRRRGRAAANVAWGSRISVLVGDSLVARLYAELSRRGELATLTALSSAVDRMCEAELRHMQLQLVGEALSEAGYYEVVRGKTGSLMAACCEIGATAADATRRQCEQVRAYGLDLGAAFQITDDVLDMVGDPDSLGKPVGNDLATGKFALPVIYALHESHDGVRELLTQLLQGDEPSPSDIREIVSVVEDLGGVEYARRAAARLADEARTHLSVLPDSPATDALHALPDFVLQRVA
ncbi:MAG: polyprenyl synthetase family protein [Armatimonadota bacterium]|jgi:geranylgeranyl pyrophosphate synthase